MSEEKKGAEKEEKLLPHQEQMKLGPNRKEEEQLLESATVRAEEDSKMLEEMANDLKRIQAEFENYKKRNAKEMFEAREHGGAHFAKSLLEFMDDLDAAVEKGEGETKKAMELVRRKFHSILEKEGLHEIKALGEKFDPYRHEAVMSQEHDGEESRVLSVMRKGYMFNGRIIRHAMVVVSKKKGEKKEKEEEKKQ